MINKLKVLGAAVVVAFAPFAVSAATVNVTNSLFDGSPDVLLDDITTATAVGGISDGTPNSLGFADGENLYVFDVDVGADGGDDSGRIEFDFVLTSETAALDVSGLTDDFALTDLVVGWEVGGSDVVSATVTGPNVNISTGTYAIGTTVTLFAEWTGFAQGETVAQIDFQVSPVPVPAAGFLLIGALGALGVARRRNKKA